MRSHTYKLPHRDMLTIVGLPIGGVLLLGLIIRLAVFLPFAPKPRPTLDVDRTVIVQQIDASNRADQADILLIGDSSCLMNIDATLLSEISGKRVTNLGTLSFLDIHTFSRLLRNYLSNQTKEPATIIFLAHPDFVRKKSSSRAHLETFDFYINQKDHAYGYLAPWDPRRLLGTHIVDGRFLSRIPIPLSGSFGRFYGFTTELMEFMNLHNGSAIDPRRLQVDDLTGSTDYRVAKFHSRQAPDLTSAIPTSAKLYLGLTPVPESFPEGDFRVEYDRLLQDWSAAFTNALSLGKLPPTLDDAAFATKTHLTGKAAKEYTRILFEQIKNQ
jgi:hypothetical protein